MSGRRAGAGAALGLLVVAMATSILHPLQLVMLSLAVLLVALPPRRPGLLFAAAALTVLVFTWPRGPLWYLERGWTLVLAGWFVLAAVAWPDSAFIKRALAATAAAMGTAALVVAALGNWSAIDWTIASHYREAAQAAATLWSTELPDAARVAEAAATLPARFFPSLLAIGSVAALGVAWWLYGRVARPARPLGRLREFRFPDELVWVLIAGVALLVLPLADWSARVGGNVVLFMSALYALRGLAVMVVVVLGLVGPHIPALIVVGLLGLLLYPIVAAGTLLLGVMDTWLDLRSGRRGTNEEG